MHLYAERLVPGWEYKELDEDLEEYLSGWGHAPSPERERYEDLLARVDLSAMAAREESPTALVRPTSNGPVARVQVGYWRKALEATAPSCIFTSMRKTLVIEQPDDVSDQDLLDAIEAEGVVVIEWLDGDRVNDGK
jgi:hypothetical protein